MSDLSEENSDAAFWYRKAAEQGDAKAQCRLGVLYARGLGVERGLQNQKAVAWFRKAAEQGHKETEFHLGNCYHYGWGVKQDDVEAVDWYRKAAEQNLLNYLCRWVWSYVRRRKRTLRPLPGFLFPAAVGYALGPAEAAKFALDDPYTEGVGVEKDKEKAAYWHRKAAVVNCVAAQYELGNLYAKGWFEGGRDVADAVVLWRKAARQGHVYAQFALGFCYRFGWGVERDDKKAAKWFRKAAKQGDAKAQYRLGFSYQYGEGVKQDDTQAAAWYRKAAEQGDAAA